jgi:hypothetical protein
MSESSGGSQSEIPGKDMIGPRLRLSLVRAAAAGLPKGKLVDAVRELGILSDTQEAEISKKIMHAVLSYWLRLHQEGCVLWSPRPALIAVARTGSALLSLLGVGPRRLSQEPEELERIMFAAPHPDLIREVLRVADGYEADNAEGATYVIQRYATIVRSVAVLVEAARRCVASLSAAETPHSRHRVSPSPESDLLQAIESDLLQAIISTYATAHELSTDAVRRLGYSKDGPLERFVRACLSVAEPGLGERITSGAIEGQFRRWKAKATPDQTPEVHSSNTPKHSAPTA